MVTAQERGLRVEFVSMGVCQRVTCQDLMGKTMRKKVKKGKNKKSSGGDVGKGRG